MESLTVAVIVALVVSIGLVRGSVPFLTSGHDDDLTGPQKFHARAVPRVGGLAVFAGAAIGLAWIYLRQAAPSELNWKLLVCAAPTLIFGLWEDFTKSISPRRRLAATAASAMLGIWLAGIEISRTHIPGVDWLVESVPYFAFALTVLVITGVANAVNIIDGFNGLASMCVMLMLSGIAYVGFQVGDPYIPGIALVVLGATFGFFILNFPAGLIFLGDGGAYFLGFMLAILGIGLVEANPAVSPLFPLMLCAYPIFETLFSIYRKKFLRGSSPSQPDRVHLHMLVYRRLMRHVLGENHTHDRRKTARNSMTSPYLWVLCLTSVVPAVLWWDHSVVLAICLVGFMILYIGLYWSIVRFRTPRWLVVRAGPDRRRAPF